MGVTHLITGFGMDRRALDCLYLPPASFRCHDLIPVEKGDTLPRYALRLAAHIGFAPGDAIGGLSFGGMLALEIARRRGASQILLISSCTHPRFVRPFFRRVGRIAPWAPRWALHLLFENTSRYLKIRGLHNSTS